MPQDTTVRNRSAPDIIATPRGLVEVVRKEVRGLRRGSGWTWFWATRRKGKVDWPEGSTAQEAIRRATLLPAGNPPGWLAKAASDAERQLLTNEPETRGGAEHQRRGGVNWLPG